MLTPNRGVLTLLAGCTAAGGVQASGRLAWEAIHAANGQFGPSALFCYGDNGPSEPTQARAVHVPSKSAAVRAALKHERSARVVLVWHIRLLKLLPLFRMPRARVALFLHGIEVWRPLSWTERLLLRSVDLFLTNSEFTWQRFVEFNPYLARAAHRVVPLGIGAPSGESTPEPEAAPRALMLSRLARAEDYKGHREVLQAWPLVLERLPAAELWIAGDGDLRSDLEQAARERGLEGAVRFLGSVSEHDKQALIARARCLALPSRGEGFGLVYAEAMRLGRPCLVSTGDAGREVVDPPAHGLAVDPSDREAVADALVRLLTDSAEWREWSRRARLRYEEQFTASHFQSRLIAALAYANEPSDARHAAPARRGRAGR
jgi:phosphatidylinositol alpha-1,6-mannosyltransferase